MKFICYTLFLIFPFSLSSQTAFKQFKKLSRPEKHWVYTHPFVAKKSMKATQNVLIVVDSIKKLGTIGSDLNGGKLDAFKHAYWMASLSISIGSRKALRLGKAHEKGNYIQYKKGKLEDSILPDSVSSVMDLYNNENGIFALGTWRTSRSPKEVQQKVLKALALGELKIIKKDEHGNYLSCDGIVLNFDNWKGKWNIPKCLIASNQD